MDHMIQNTTERILDLARRFAIAHHGEQKYGPNPYSFHLDGVVKIIQDEILTLDIFKWYDHTLIKEAGYFHDLLEDTACSYQELSAIYGHRVADLVHCLTDEPGKNRKERKAKTYPKLKAGGPLVIAIKLADRIFNVEYSLAAKDDSKFNMYFKEQNAFKEALYDPNHDLGKIWTRLDINFTPPNNW